MISSLNKNKKWLLYMIYIVYEAYSTKKKLKIKKDIYSKQHPLLISMLLQIQVKVLIKY